MTNVAMTEYAQIARKRYTKQYKTIDAWGFNSKSSKINTFCLPLNEKITIDKLIFDNDFLVDRLLVATTEPECIDCCFIDFELQDVDATKCLALPHVFMRKLTLEAFGVKRHAHLALSINFFEGTIEMQTRIEKRDPKEDFEIIGFEISSLAWRDELGI